MLISIQAQAINQCVVMVIRVVLMMMLVVMVTKDTRLISRGLVGIFGVWAR